MNHEIINQITVKFLRARIKRKVDDEIVQHLTSSVMDASDESGLANLSDVGGILRNKKPDFDQRTYGYTKLSDLFKAVEEFELVEKEEVTGAQVVYVKIRE